MVLLWAWWFFHIFINGEGMSNKFVNGAKWGKLWSRKPKSGCKRASTNWENWVQRNKVNFNRVKPKCQYLGAGGGGKERRCTNMQWVIQGRNGNVSRKGSTTQLAIALILYRLKGQILTFTWYWILFYWNITLLENPTPYISFLLCLPCFELWAEGRRRVVLLFEKNQFLPAQNLSCFLCLPNRLIVLPSLYLFWFSFGNLGENSISWSILEQKIAMYQ